MQLEPLESRRLLAALVITKGGTYRGTWDSMDPEHPAVVVKTSEKVIIEDSNITSKGDLIATGVSHTNVTIRRTTGTALNPNVFGRAPGRFLQAEDFDNIVIDNNVLKGTRGIHLLNYRGDRTTNETIRIVDNVAVNIDGRRSNGAGGWLDYNRKINLTTGAEELGFAYAQFVQFDKVHGVPGVEIAWNQVINEPGNSRVEDNINIYKSSGTSTSPIRIHNNYIQGAYTIKPTQVSYNANGYRHDWSYSGGGILLGDGADESAANDAAYVKAYDNQVVSTTNYGIAIAAGHDMEIRNNRVFSSGRLPDGGRIAQQNVGIYVWDSYDIGPARFYNNIAHHNLVAWVNHQGRNDVWTNQSETTFDNTSWNGTLSIETERAERTRWDAKVKGPHTGTLAGTIFADLDEDAARDPTDPGRRGVRVFIDLNHDGQFDANEPSSLTTSTGRWRLDVTPGEYTVRMDTPRGWRTTRGVSATFVVSAGNTLTRYFGLAPAAVITGLVYMDANKDGQKSALEDSLPAWQVFVDQNDSGTWDADEPLATTNAKGWFAFLNLLPGTYRIRAMPNVNYRQTAPEMGYHDVTVGAGTTVVAGYFGEKRIKK